MYPFNQAYVNAMPAARGVYTLYQLAELIYIGRASGEGVTIRSRLQSHLNGTEGRCTQMADQFSIEVCNNPIQREKELLEWYHRQYGRLPRCNERIG